MAAASTTDGDVSAFVLQQSRLVALERLDDITTSAAAMQSLSEKDAVKAGLCIPRLLLSDCKAGLYGRCLVTFVPERGDVLPASQIGVRDIVSIQPKAAASSGSQQWWKDGVVYRQTDRLIVVAIEEYPDVEQRLGSFSLTRLANEVTYQRYSAALKQLQDRGVMGHDSSRPLQVLYGGVAPSTTPTAVSVDLSPNGRHQRLNSIQEAAINQALSSNDVFVLHGPPGTGHSAAHITRPHFILRRCCLSRFTSLPLCRPTQVRRRPWWS